MFCHHAVTMAGRVQRSLLSVAIGGLLLLPGTTFAKSGDMGATHAAPGHTKSNAASAHESSTNVPKVAFEDASVALLGFTHTNHNGPHGDNISGLAWLDCDNDGDLDLYVGNGVGADDGLLRNNGDGSFTNITGKGAGDIGDKNGTAGVATADLDNDGNVDVVVSGDSAFLLGLPAKKRMRVYKNNGNCKFSDVTDAVFDNISTAAGATGQVSLGDINNDGLLDIFMVAPASLTNMVRSPNHLYLNKGKFKFEDVTKKSGDADYIGGACVSAFTHYDDDDYIDLFVGDCNLKEDRFAHQDWVMMGIWSPPGDSAPVDQTTANEDWRTWKRPASKKLAANYDTIKMIPAFASTPMRLLLNNGDSTFSRISANLPDPLPLAEQPFPPTERGYWMSLSLGDYDNDGDFDLFSTNVGEVFGMVNGLPQPHYFGERLANGNFTSVEHKAGIADIGTKFGWGSAFADFNQDGWEDLIFAGNLPELGGQWGNPGYLFTNNGDKTFRNDLLPINMALRFTSGLATADYDNDGQVDVVINNGALARGLSLPGIVYIPPGDDHPTLLRNVSKSGHNWLTVKLVGTTSNRSAIGAQIKVRFKGTTMTREVRAGQGFLSTNSPWQNFGLGDSDKKTQNILVRWPSGLVETFDVPTRKISTIKEGKGKKQDRFRLAEK